MAHELGMHLHTYLGMRGPMTHRQHLTWLAWLLEQWNRPSRSDAYQMQTACEVRRVLSKKPNQVQPKHFRIKFDTRRRARKVASAEQPKSQAKSQVAKARWLAMVSPKKDDEAKVARKNDGGQDRENKVTRVRRRE